MKLKQTHIIAMLIGVILLLIGVVVGILIKHSPKQNDKVAAESSSNPVAVEKAKQIAKEIAASKLYFQAIEPSKKKKHKDYLLVWLKNDANDLVILSISPNHLERAKVDKIYQNKSLSERTIFPLVYSEASQGDLPYDDPMAYTNHLKLGFTP